MKRTRPHRLGKVYLMVIPPGQASWLTRRGIECLARADLVLYDRDIDPTARNHANPSSEEVCAHEIGSPEADHLGRGEPAAARMIDAARQGKTVVRLKGGEPCGLGGGIEEIEALRTAGIPFEVLAPATPLWGRRILLTRGRDQIAALRQRFAELGADVMLQPAIEITDPPNWESLDDALEQLERFDWLVFSSVNGVRYLTKRMSQCGDDPRRLKRLKLAAIGPATADELARCGLKTDLVPREYRAEALAEALIVAAGGGHSTNAPAEPTGLAGKRFLLARASRGRETLAQRLSAAGATVDQVVVYSSIDVRQPEPEVADAMAQHRIDWVTVTSSAIARAVVGLFGEQLRHCKLASISPVTSESLRQLRLEPAVEATQYTLEGLIEAILRHVEGCEGK